MITPIVVPLRQQENFNGVATPDTYVFRDIGQFACFLVIGKKKSEIQIILIIAGLEKSRGFRSLMLAKSGKILIEWLIAPAAVIEFSID